jgi:hypothetical protein
MGNEEGQKKRRKTFKKKIKNWKRRLPSGFITNTVKTKYKCKEK